MNIQRRLLLKGMAMGSISGLGLARPGIILADELTHTTGSTPVLLLVNSETRYSAFYQGVQAAVGPGSLQVQITDPGMDFLLVVQRHIRDGQGRRVVGLVDDAGATLIVDQARAAGAHMYWLSQHAVGPDHSRHQLWTTRIGCSRETLFSHQPVTCDAQGTGPSLSKGNAGESWVPCRLTSHGCDEVNTVGEQWVANLGLILADSGWTVSATAPRADAGPALLPGHFVSFAFET